MAETLYFTGQVSQVPLAFTGDGPASQIVVTGSVAAAGPPGKDSTVPGPPGTTDYTLLTNKPTLAPVATSGSYTDLTSKPAIPTVPTLVSAFTNDSGYLTSSSLSTYATQSYVTTQINNLLGGASTALDTLGEIGAQLASDESAAAALTTAVAGKQATLVSGTNIKTINGSSLLGSGNLDISTTIEAAAAASSTNGYLAYDNDGNLVLGSHSSSDGYTPSLGGVAGFGLSANMAIDSTGAFEPFLFLAANGNVTLESRDPAALAADRYIRLSGDGGLKLNTHSTDDSVDTVLRNDNQTATRTIQLPDASGTVALTSDVASKAPMLNPTAVKTAAYTASANDFVPVDTTSNSVTITLPSAPANGTRFGVKMVIQGGTNTVTITRGGTDVFNKAAGNTSVTVSLLNQGVQFQYFNGIWYGVAADLGLTALDARYQAAGSYAPATGIAESAVTNLVSDLGTITANISTNTSNISSNTTAIATKLTTAGAAKITVSTSTPSSPATGDLWVDTN